jgi:hypothetical protein
VYIATRSFIVREAFLVFRCQLRTRIRSSTYAIQTYSSTRYTLQVLPSSKNPTLDRTPVERFITLPSWVPDLSNTKAPPTPRYEGYRATGESLIQWQLTRNSNELWLSGISVDRIRLYCDGTKSPNKSVLQQNEPLPSDTETGAAS